MFRRRIVRHHNQQVPIAVQTSTPFRTAPKKIDRLRLEYGDDAVEESAKRVLLCCGGIEHGHIDVIFPDPIQSYLKSAVGRVFVGGREHEPDRFVTIGPHRSFAQGRKIPENVYKFSGKCDYKLPLRSTNLVYREWWGDDGGCGDRGTAARAGAGVVRTPPCRARRAPHRRARSALALVAGVLWHRDRGLFRAEGRASPVAGPGD